MVNNLVTFVERLRAAVVDDSVMKPRVDKCGKVVTGMTSVVR